MKNKSILLILLCIILTLGMLILAGCAGDSGTEEPDGAGNGVENGTGSEAEEEVYQVSLYFANQEYFSTGDESLDKFNIFDAEITSNPEDVYGDALELLREPSDEKSSTAVTEQIKFNDVYLEGDTVYVDLDGSELHGGSSSEAYLVSQIVNTLMGFDEVKQVQFLVDGEIAETLMGHVGTAEPFTKDVFE